MFAQYQRLGVHVGASSLAVIRAARARMTAKARRDPLQRRARHEFYRRMLHEHSEARALYRRVMSGSV